MKNLVRIAVALAFTATVAHADISLWPTIPFVRGADLCQYSEAYGSTRQETIRQSASVALEFMRSGATGGEALKLLTALNKQVDKNRALAVQGQGLDVMLESTLRAGVDELYRQLTPRTRKIQFTHAAPLAELVRDYQNNQRPMELDSTMLRRLSGFAYGTYSYAPGCRGDLVVTLTIITKGGKTDTFSAQNKPERVMGDIAARLFEAYQRTTFPATIRVGRTNLTIVGGINGFIDRARSPELAEAACDSLDARLPTDKEYEIASLYGSWSGGVSLNQGTWALANGYIYHAAFTTMPVRRPWEVNETEFLYYCVR